MRVGKLGRWRRAEDNGKVGLIWIETTLIKRIISLRRMQRQTPSHNQELQASKRCSFNLREFWSAVCHGPDPRLKPGEIMFEREVRLKLDDGFARRVARLVQFLTSLLTLKLVTHHYEIHSRLPRYKEEWRGLVAMIQKALLDSRGMSDQSILPEVLLYNPTWNWNEESTHQWKHQWSYTDNNLTNE